jgi:hypothetical protein
MIIADRISMMYLQMMGLRFLDHLADACGINVYSKTSYVSS